MTPSTPDIDIDTPTTTPNGVPLLHADHGLDARHLALIDEVMEDREGFFLLSLPLEGALGGSLQSGLYGPVAGDPPVTEAEVEYVVRNERPGPSRLVSRPLRDADHLVVIGVAGGENPKVFTAYGNRGTVIPPREWWDPTMKPQEAMEAAAFWQQHALSND